MRVVRHVDLIGGRRPHARGVVVTRDDVRGAVAVLVMFAVLLIAGGVVCGWIGGFVASL